MSDMETRQQLLASTERHERELERALVDLKHVVQRPFALGDQLGEHPQRQSNRQTPNRAASGGA